MLGSVEGTKEKLEVLLKPNSAGSEMNFLQFPGGEEEGGYSKGKISLAPCKAGEAAFEMEAALGTSSVQARSQSVWGPN